MGPWNLTDDLQKQKGTSYNLLQAVCIILWPLINSNWSYSPETPNLCQIRRCFVPCDLEIWRMTLKNNRAPLLCYFKLCASFRSHEWIQTGVTVRIRLNRVLTSVTLTLDLWPWPLAWTSLLAIIITPPENEMSWWYDKRNIMKRCDRQTDGRTDGQTDRHTGQTDRHKEVFLELLGRC